LVARLERRISSAEKNWVGGWEGMVLRESWGAPETWDISVLQDSIVFRRGDGEYPIGMIFEARVMVVSAIE